MKERFIVFIVLGAGLSQSTVLVSLNYLGNLSLLGYDVEKSIVG